MDAYSHLRNRVDQLSKLTDDEWEDFSVRWKPVMVDKGDFTIRTGQTEKYFYFVHEGVLRAFVLINGVDVSVGFSYDGDFSGAYDSFLDQEPADWNIHAISAVEALRITFDDLMEMFDKYKSLERWGRDVYKRQAFVSVNFAHSASVIKKSPPKFERL